MQRTTHISKDQKLLSLLESINCYFEERRTDSLKEVFKEAETNYRLIVQIDRYTVKGFIRSNLEITDHHTVNGWMTMLVNDNYLILHRTASNNDNSKIIYYIQNFEVKAKIHELYRKLHSTPTLHNFIAQESTKVESQSKVDTPPHASLDSALQTQKPTPLVELTQATKGNSQNSQQNSASLKSV